MSAPRIRDLAGNAILATVYVVAGKLGLTITAVAGFVTPVWAPTGLALAALVLFGRRLWPGVALGALLVNLWMGASAGVALGISAGNTLEAVVGASALRRVPGFDPGLGRVKDVLALIVFAALMSTLACATLGVASLFLGGVVARTELVETWRVWWVGDLEGVLVVAPLLMATPGMRSFLRDGRRLREGLVLALLVVVLGKLVFWSEPSSPLLLTFLPVSFFPLLIWAALRFGVGGAAVATFLASVMAIWGTALGTGAFADRALPERLVLLQSFMANLAVAALLLAAVVTERERARDAVTRAHAELEMRVQQRTAELRAAVRDLSEEVAERQRVAEQLHRREEQLRDAVRARDEVLGVVAHDLRTPLSAAQLATRAIVRMLPEEDASTSVRGMAVTADKALQRATRLIRDLLDVTRVEGGTLAVERRPVPARELVVEVTDALAAVASQKALELLADIEGELPPVLADSGRIIQVFSNLVDNAAKFSPSGGRVRIGAHRADGHVCFSVADTGAGIDAEDVPHLFDRFWKGRRTDRRGAGLGLAIAKGIIDAHGGRIWVESTPGVGSTFYFTIPIASADDRLREALADGPVT